MILGTSLKRTHAPRRMSEGGLVKTMLGPRDSVASLLQLFYLLPPYHVPRGDTASPRSNSGMSGDTSNSSSDAAEDAFEKCYSQVQTFPKC